ncbi:lipoprotein [Dietzia sp. SLG510A3-3B2-2]|nr:lipoprotein [Dietzia sp. SLG510A3-40A3]MBB1010099.1 lipoprotein [Dietzia sp. SLG510A3-3B2-2]
MKKHALVITLLAALTACSPEGTDGEQPTSAPPAANEAATAVKGQ